MTYAQIHFVQRFKEQFIRTYIAKPPWPGTDERKLGK